MYPNIRCDVFLGSLRIKIKHSLLTKLPEESLRLVATGESRRCNSVIRFRSACPPASSLGISSRSHDTRPATSPRRPGSAHRTIGPIACQLSLYHHVLLLILADGVDRPSGPVFWIRTKPPLRTDKISSEDDRSPHPLPCQPCTLNIGLVWLC